MDILIVGPYPPPLGGNSVHIQRLVSLLQAEKHRVKVLDMFADHPTEHSPSEVLSSGDGVVGKLRMLISTAWSTPYDTVVHIHVSAMGRFKFIAPFLLILFLRQIKVITIHSGSFISKTTTHLQCIYVKFLLNRFHGIIVVNQEQANHLKGLGVLPQKLNLIPAFLPPPIDATDIPYEIKSISGKKTLVVTSGYLTPLYHYEVLVDCIAHLDPGAFHFVFAFYNAVDLEYEAKIYVMLQQFANVSIIRDQPPEVFAALLRQSDIYVRTALTDGDAVAVREALYFGKTVFASSCVMRPDNCYVYQSGNSSDLCQLFLSGNESTYRPSEPYFQQILHVYNSISA